MNTHVAPVKEALEGFCRAYASDSDNWHVDVYPSGLMESVHALIVHPAFARMGRTERLNRIWEFFKNHLAVEHQVNVTVTRAVTPDEYEEMQAADRAARAMALAC